MKILISVFGILSISLCAVAQTAPEALGTAQAPEGTAASIDAMNPFFSSTVVSPAAAIDFTPKSATAPAAAASSAAAAVQPSTASSASATPVEKEIEQHNALADGEKAAAKTEPAKAAAAKTGNQAAPSAESSSAATSPAAALPAKTEKPAVSTTAVTGKAKQKKAAKKPVAKVATPVAKVAPPAADEAVAQEELDYAARLMRQEKQESTSGRFIPRSPSQTGQPETVAKERVYNPNSYRPGVEWQRNDSSHFEIYNQKRSGGIGSSNMALTFESAYATLRRYIPWMMSGKVKIFVYQDHNNYLKHEPNAKAWTRALAYPTRGEIVVYDEPGKQQELQEVFTHELTHIFTQQFFDKHNSGRLMTPTWLDEGLAVYMEDQAYRGSRGGPWSHDLRTLNFQRSPESQVAQFGSTSMFGSSARKFTFDNRRRGKPIYFLPFDQFMQEGSLSYLESQNKTQDWYFQAFAMVRFLLNPAGGVSPSNRMQFEQFTRLIAQGEQVRDPQSGFLVRDENGKQVYQPYSTEKALGRAYRYNNAANFEDAFWHWANNVH